MSVQAANQLTEVLTDVFTTSLSQAIVPASFKTTTVVEESSVTCMNNYCPVALIVILTKDR